MKPIETVKIKVEGGFIIINKSDFDPSKHQLFDAQKKAVEVTVSDEVIVNSTQKEPKKTFSRSKKAE